MNSGKEYTFIKAELGALREKVTTREIEVVDREGRVRILGSVDEMNRVEVGLLDQAGNVRVSLVVGEESCGVYVADDLVSRIGLFFEGPDDLASINIQNRDMAPRVTSPRTIWVHSTARENQRRRGAERHMECAD